MTRAPPRPNPPAPRDRLLHASTPAAGPETGGVDLLAEDAHLLVPWGLRLAEIRRDLEVPPYLRLHLRQRDAGLGVDRLQDDLAVLKAVDAEVGDDGGRSRAGPQAQFLPPPRPAGP